MRLHKRLFPLIASLLLALPAAADDMPKPAKIIPGEAKAMPAVNFLDAEGHKVTLDPSKGKLTLLHFWATWCVPCVKELPEVDKVANAYRQKGLQVVPLSLDGGNMARVLDFYKAHHISHLSANFDAGTTALRAVKANGLPFSVFINAKGEEIARAKGWVEWDKPEAKTFLDGALK